MKNGKASRQPNHNPQASYRYKRIKEYIYDMQQVLGKGNFSTVYRGQNQDKNHEVAVKVIKLSSLTFPKLEELLEQEISISRQLDHDNTIRCHEVLKSVNHCYFITELCSEGTLQKKLKLKGTLTEDQIYPFIKDVFEGLRYLHSKNIVHRDVKLANIFVKSGKAKIADFGFAVHAKETFKDVNIGSPLYMSPEGYLDHIYGPKTDVWAFGVILFELLHGKAPLSHLGSQQQLKHELRKPLPSDCFRPDISPELKDLIMRCLEVNESKRISIPEIGKLPYLQNRNQFITELKLNTMKFRRMSVPNTMQFVRTSVKTFKENQNKENQQNKEGKKQQEKEKGRFLTARELPIPKRMEKVSSDQIQENTSIMLDYREQDLLTTNITFNQSIGLIHFCRVGFKLTQEHLPDQLKRMVKSIILKILEEIKLRVSEDKIHYNDLQNKEKKEKKLKLVLGEYSDKYSRQIQSERTQVVMHQIEDSFGRYLQNCEENILEHLNHTYLCMLFIQFSSVLVSSIKSKRYAFFGENGLLDNCLHEENIPGSASDYFTAKHKYQYSCGQRSSSSH